MDLTKLSSYYYDLPQELIAQTPIEPRDHSRLLVCDKQTGQLEHKHFYDIIDYLNKGDVLVINNTKVIPCRLLGKKRQTGANIEVFLLKRINTTDWEALVGNAKRLKIGSVVEFSPNFSCEIIQDLGYAGGRLVRFSFEGAFEQRLDEVGIMPLPPYIKEKLQDRERYQTVYSKTNGSSAAPTAGLHFTPELLEKIKAKGVEVVEILLHVGLGTFRPVKCENILEHDMHTEYYEVTQQAADTINKAKQNGNKIIAVGTTSVRTLESSNINGAVVAQKANTNIFIYPSYKFKVVDSIITNFHLPESTLIMLVCAYLGYDLAMDMYKTAVEDKYRFFSFGDATFLH